MKATHKLKALGDVASIIGASPSVSAAARRLGVDRSTVHRWIEAGKAPRPGAARRRRQVDTQVDPQDWAAAVRARYQLTATEAVLLELAERALALAREEKARPVDRLAAMARFQGLIKQLNFEVDTDGKTETPGRRTGPWPRRVG